MQRLWPGDALDFESAVVNALDRLGGVELARRCEADGDVRAARLGPVVGELGFDELDPTAGEVEASAAALGARALGAVVAPWPIVQQLAGNAAGVGAVYLTAGRPRRKEHLDLVGDPVAIDVVARTARRLVVDGGATRMPLDPFGVPCALGEPVELPVEQAVAVHVVLDGFWVLGALETSLRLSQEYAAQRRQFGRPIAAFGAIQWRLADIAVAHGQLLETSGHALAALIDRRLSTADVLGVRLQTIESARAVLADAHQVLGAIGLCEEHDVTVIDRHLQPVLSRPLGLAQTTSLLARQIAADGFDGLYPVDPRGEAVGQRDGAPAVGR